MAEKKSKFSWWPRSTKWRITVAVLYAMVFSALIVLLYNYSPTNAHYYPQCPSKMLFGIDCPGCGTTRAVNALLHGDIAAAWHYNPALFFLVPMFIFYFWAESRPVQSVWYRRINSPYVPAGMVVLIILWTILRNVF